MTAYQVPVSSNTFGDSETSFSMPSAAPAAQAAAIRLAVTLRIADY